jgi:intracellular septation protein A
MLKIHCLKLKEKSWNNFVIICFLIKSGLDRINEFTWIIYSEEHYRHFKSVPITEHSLITMHRGLIALVNYLEQTVGWGHWGG